MLLKILRKFFRHMYKQVYDLKTTDEPILIVDASKRCWKEYESSSTDENDSVQITANEDLNGEISLTHLLV